MPPSTYKFPLTITSPVYPIPVYPVPVGPIIVSVNHWEGPFATQDIVHELEIVPFATKAGLRRVIWEYAPLLFIVFICQIPIIELSVICVICKYTIWPFVFIKVSKPWSQAV